MLALCEGTVADEEPGNHDREPEPGPPITGVSRRSQPSAVDLRFVPAGTELVVVTHNSRYRLVLLDDRWNVIVQGGRHFEQETIARVDGCTSGGCLLKRGWIAEGLCLEIYARGERIVTSRVRAVSVVPTVEQPDTA